MAKIKDFSDADIARMKEEFNQEIVDYYTGRHSKPEWDTKRIADVISRLENPPSTRQSKNYYYHNTYELKTIDGKKVLTSKKSNQSNKTIVIVPSEEYFDIVFKAHLETNHGGRDKMIACLKDSVYIPTTVIALFSKYCKTCKIKKIVKRSRASNPNEYRRGFLHIVNMSKTPCDAFTFILYYQDLQTNFSFLRPLVDDSIEEISMELTKIFLELGGPAILNTTRDHFAFTKSVVDAIKKLYPDYVMLVGKTVDAKQRAECDMRIRSKVQNWMMHRKSQRWSIGVQFVQFEMNSTFNEELARTPYMAMFGTPPKMGIDTNDIPTEIVKTLKDECDFTDWQCSKKVKRVRLNCFSEPKACVSKPIVVQIDGSGNGSSSADKTQERVWCWVCEKDDDAVTALCTSCNGAIHKACGKYRDKFLTNIECILCYEDDNWTQSVAQPAIQSVQIKMDPDPDVVEVKPGVSPEVIVQMKPEIKDEFDQEVVVVVTERDVETPVKEEVIDPLGS